jgi:hypothetical protein
VDAISGRERVVPVRVAISDPPVGTVDDDLAVLRSSDLACALDGLALRGVVRGVAAIALATHTPALGALYNMLIGDRNHLLSGSLPHHRGLPEGIPEDTVG